MKCTRVVQPAFALICCLLLGQLGCAEKGVSATPDVRALTKFSNDGKAFTASVSAARVAIFNGDPKAAKDLMAKAQTSLQAAKTDAPSFRVKTTMSAQGKIVSTEQASATAAMVPVDGQMVIADDYVVSPERQAHINKANEHLKKGEAKEAADELRLAQIDVNFNRTWIPISASEKHLSDAIKLANEDKYYEANLALKAIEDGYTMDSVALAEEPKK